MIGGPSRPSQGEGQKHTQALASTREDSRVLASACECLLVLASAFAPAALSGGGSKALAVTGRGGASDGHKVVTWWSPRVNLVVGITKLWSVFEAEVSWSTVYYTLDFSAIWISHLQNTETSNLLRFLLKLAPVTWDHVSHVVTWPHAFLATLMLVWGVL